MGVRNLNFVLLGGFDSMVSVLILRYGDSNRGGHCDYSILYV